MPSSISRDDLQTILHEADVAARRLLRQLRLGRTDLDDLRQDLLVDLIARLPAFDPDRGSLGAFAGIVLANRARRLAKKARRDRRLFGATPVSLDDVVPGTDGLARGDLIAEAGGMAAWFGQPVDAFAATERRIDVERGLGSLSPSDGAFCAALSHTTADRLAARGLGTRSCLYRRAKEVRLALSAVGVAPAWDGSASA